MTPDERLVAWRAGKPFTCFPPAVPHRWWTDQDWANYVTFIEEPDENPTDTSVRPSDRKRYSHTNRGNS